MRHPGYIYVMRDTINANVVKIGFTKDPYQRLRALYNTSTPEPYFIEYLWEVKDMKMAEYAAHYALKDHRINEDREFFYIVPPRLQNALPGDDDPETLDGYLCTLVGIIEDYFEYSDLYFNLVDFNDVIVKRKDRFDRFPGGNIKGF